MMSRPSIPSFDVEPEQAWREHLVGEREWECSEHGLVEPTGRRIHGGRGRAMECPITNCTRALHNTGVDWDAYHDAVDAGENPPCPRCGSTDVDTAPVSPQYRCPDCSHAFGSAAGYY